MSTRYYASYFPEAEEMNPFLFQDAKDWKMGSVERLKNGYRDEYPWRYYTKRRDVKQIDSLLTWIEGLIPSIHFVLKTLHPFVVKLIVSNTAVIITGIKTFNSK